MFRYFTPNTKTLPSFSTVSRNILHPVYRRYNSFFQSFGVIYRPITSHEKSEEGFKKTIDDKDGVKQKQLRKQDENNKSLVINYIQNIINGDTNLLNVIESIVDIKLGVVLLNHYISAASIIELINNPVTRSNYGYFQRNRTRNETALELQNIFSSRTNINWETKNLSTFPTKKTKSEVIIADNKKVNFACANDNGDIKKKLVTSNAKNNNNSASKILELNDKNFKSAVLKHKLLLVMFYAPWCKYCNDFKPLFFRTAKELPKDVGSLAVCNGDTSKKIALKYNVYVFPTLKLFCKGEYVTDYSGPRRSLELLKFMIAQAEKVNKTDTC